MTLLIWHFGELKEGPLGLRLPGASAVALGSNDSALRSTSDVTRSSNAIVIKFVAALPLQAVGVPYQIESINQSIVVHGVEAWSSCLLFSIASMTINLLCLVSLVPAHRVRHAMPVSLLTSFRIAFRAATL